MDFYIEFDLDSIKELNLPSSLVEFLKIANAASPKNDEIKIDSKSYNINNILDFNSDAKLESFRKYMKNFKDILKPSEIIFARDGFGNVYLLDLDSMIVRFYDSEVDKKIDLISFSEFIKLLG